MDHVWQIQVNGPPEQEMLEPYTALGYMAALTSRVQLLTLVTGVVYRPPGLLAKMVTTLDVLSAGRALLGIGSGDYPEEASGLGLPFPEQARDRFDLLEETVQACLAMWEGEHGSEQPFEGRRVRLERPLNLPQSLSRPHPPVLIAGSGEKRTLPLLARYGDACNIRAPPGIPRHPEPPPRRSEYAGRDHHGTGTDAPRPVDGGGGR